MKNWDQIAKRD